VVPVTVMITPLVGKGRGARSRRENRGCGRFPDAFGNRRGRLPARVGTTSGEDAQPNASLLCRPASRRGCLYLRGSGSGRTTSTPLVATSSIRINQLLSRCRSERASRRDDYELPVRGISPSTPVASAPPSALRQSRVAARYPSRGRRMEGAAPLVAARCDQGVVNRNVTSSRWGSGWSTNVTSPVAPR
jgi:hypothetical protein